jgi:hypothetical protein
VLSSENNIDNQFYKAIDTMDCTGRKQRRQGGRREVARLGESSYDLSRAVNVMVASSLATPRIERMNVAHVSGEKGWGICATPMAYRPSVTPSQGPQQAAAGSALKL